MTQDFIESVLAFHAQAQSKRAHVSLVGDLALDRFVIGHADRLSPEAPVPVLLVNSDFEQLGCAANVARNVAELFQDFRQLELLCVGVVGQDEVGQRLKKGLSTLSATQLKLSLLEDPSRPTTLKTRFIAGNARSQHQLLRVDIENDLPVSAELRLQCYEALKNSFKDSAVLVVQDYAKGLMDEAFLQKILKGARESGVRTIVDPNRRTRPESYKGAWMITPNIEEAEVILGRSLHRGESDQEVSDACHEIQRRLQIDVVMITRSRSGMSFVDESGSTVHVPSMARAVSDVTGAGDTVVAVLAVALSLGAAIGVAARLANAAAAVVVGKAGTATASWAEMLTELRHQVDCAAR